MSKSCYTKEEYMNQAGVKEVEVGVIGEVPGSVQGGFLFLHFFGNLLNFLAYLMIS